MDYFWIQMMISMEAKNRKKYTQHTLSKTTEYLKKMVSKIFSKTNMPSHDAYLTTERRSWIDYKKKEKALFYYVVCLPFSL